MMDANRKYHSGLGFDLWTNRGAWFWRLAGRCCGSATIGSALTENEALREAYAAVDELTARCERTAPSRVTSLGHRDRLLAAGPEDFAMKHGRNTGDI
jgi:hypothetical protein